MDLNPACIFCRIIAGKAPATIHHRDEWVTAFDDIHPIAPVHVLIVPNRHIVSLNDATAQEVELLGRMNVLAGQLAATLGIHRSGYRLVINTGADAGQSVLHLHLHLLGGRHLPFNFQ